MKIFNFSAVCLCAILSYCCNSDKNSDNNSKIAESTVIAQKPEKELDPKMRSQALAVLDFRIKNDPTSYAIIEAGVLNYLFVYNGREMSKKDEYTGNWIDFKPDFTYDYGKNDQTTGGGRYHYSMKKNQLVMVDNSRDQNPQEWDIKTGGDVIIMIGTKTYGNNAFQIKLERSDDRKAVQPVQ